MHVVPSRARDYADEGANIGAGNIDGVMGADEWMGAALHHTAGRRELPRRLSCNLKESLKSVWHDEFDGDGSGGA